MNIKFPKEEIRMIEIIREAILYKKHFVIVEQYDNVINNAKFFKQYYESILNEYLKALFDAREFEKVVCFIEDLKKQNLENCEWYFYAFICLIAKKDIYYIKSLISRSNLLNNESIKHLIDENDANYNYIINLHYDLLMTIGPCLILITFVNELFSESFDIKLEDDYIVMRFFDLLNLLFEYGVEEEIIEIFRNSLETLYEIEIV